MQVRPDDIINMITKHQVELLYKDISMFIKNSFFNNYFGPFDVDDNSDSDL